MKTKFIKVAVNERLPEKEGWYFTIDPHEEYQVWKWKNGYRWEGIEFFLLEVPDREDEMREMLEECRLQLEHLNSFKQRGTTNSLLSRLNTLLNELKQ